MNQYITIPQLQKILCSLAALFIVLYLPYFYETFTYDEPHYLSNLDLIHQYGLGSDYLKNMKGPAGPLHSYIHYFLFPITDGDVIKTRSVSLILGFLSCLFIYLTLKKRAPQHSWLALLFFSFPMTFSAVTLAHTEIPAMLFVTLWLFLLSYVYTLRDQRNSSFHYLYSSLGGIFLGLGIAGRQPYLICALSLYILFLNFLPIRKWYLLLMATIAMIPTVFLFSHWGGIAPDIGREIATKGTFSLLHLLLGLGYGAFCMMIVAPHYFIKLNKKIVFRYGISAILIMVISFICDFQFLPLYSTLIKIFPSSILPLIGFSSVVALSLLGMYFIHSLSSHCMAKRNNPYYLFISCCMLLLLCSLGGVTHIFSTRYVFQAVPFFIIIAAYHYKPSLLSLAMTLTGVTLGGISLVNYLS